MAKSTKTGTRRRQAKTARRKTRSTRSSGTTRRRTTRGRGARREGATRPKRAPAASRRTARRTGTPTRRDSRTTGRRTRSWKWIDSVDQQEDRPGQTLATRQHEVIQRWAEARQAVPATVASTEHDGRPGVLRFNFPGYGGANLREIEWEEWFRPFDERQLVFLYQEHKRDGAQSNFFRLENPEREDA